jgi:hypothetical protein
VWSLPSQSDDGTPVHGRVLKPSATGAICLLDLDVLLAVLGERIFVAEQTAGIAEQTAGTAEQTAGTVEQTAGIAEQTAGIAEQTAGTAELVSETAWSLTAAAGFALDCAEHVVGDGAGVALPSGETLSDVIAAARKWLEQAETDTGLLARFSRMAALRRLRKQADEVAGLAFDAAIDVEVADKFVFDDARWTSIAATRDAVLSAIEVIRHTTVPHLSDVEQTRYEERSTSTQDPVITTFETPWGPLNVGFRQATVPAWVAAAEAAERARQAAEDAGDTAAASTERAWQRDRLLQALRGL